MVDESDGNTKKKVGVNEGESMILSMTENRCSVTDADAEHAGDKIMLEWS